MQRHAQPQECIWYKNGNVIMESKTGLATVILDKEDKT